MANEFLHQRHVDENRSVRSALLAAATAAIAFAFHETGDRQLSWSLLPTLIAILFWAGSFVAGIWASRQIQIAVKSNVVLLEALQAGNEQIHAQARAAFDKANDDTWKFQERQLWSLFIGAGFYLAGHIGHVYEASVAVQEAQTAIEAPAPPPPGP